jgi:hypothetical protein
VTVRHSGGSDPGVRSDLHLRPKADDTVSNPGLGGPERQPETFGDLDVCEPLVERELERLTLDLGQVPHRSDRFLAVELIEDDVDRVVDVPLLN